jgi:glycosyltransferase involved in cell wall biosynthesis
VRRQAADSAGVTVTGAVPDVRPYLWNAAIAVAPIVMSHGVQNKVLEAAAAGLPVVITTPVLEGLPPEVLPACTVADTPAAFASAILAFLSQTAAERRAFASRADVPALGWDRRLAGLQSIVTAVANGA